MEKGETCVAVAVARVPEAEHVEEERRMIGGDHTRSHVSGE